MSNPPWLDTPQGDVSGQVGNLSGWEGEAPVNGTRLYYQMAGAGSGPPLVLVHGALLDCRMWDPQFHAFARTHMVVRYDLRGHGRSAPAGALEYHDHEDLRGLLDYLGIRRAHLVALSAGAQIAIEHALAYPQATASVIAVAPDLGGYSYRADDWSLLLDAATESSGGDRGSAADLLLDLPVLRPSMDKQGIASQVVRMLRGHDAAYLKRYASGGLAGGATVKMLGRVSVPALAMVGEWDLEDYHATASLLAERAPGARKVVLRGAGHLANLESPHSFNKAVLGFLSRVSAPAGATVPEGLA